MKVNVVLILGLLILLMGCASSPKSLSREEHQFLREELTKFKAISGRMTDEALIGSITFFSQTDKSTRSELLLYTLRNNIIILELAGRGEEARSILIKYKADYSGGLLAACGSGVAPTLPGICGLLLARLDANTSHERFEEIERWLDDGRKRVRSFL